jgi:hypothetical protein
MTESIYAPRQPGSALRGIGVLVGILAALAAVGAVVGGVALIVHTGCSGADAFGDCLTTTHPWAPEGWAVLIGGLLNAFVVGVVGVMRCDGPTVVPGFLTISPLRSRA